MTAPSKCLDSHLVSITGRVEAGIDANAGAEAAELALPLLAASRAGPAIIGPTVVPNAVFQNFVPSDSIVEGFCNAVKPAKADADAAKEDVRGGGGAGTLSTSREVAENTCTRIVPIKSATDDASDDEDDN